MKILYTALFILLLTITACKAPEGPARVSGDVPEASGWQVETVLDGLEHPWAVVWLNDTDMLITERPGRLRWVRDGELQREPVSGVPAVFADGQAGLLDVTIHPDFAENGFVYLTYAAGNDDANRTTLARGMFSDGALSDVQVLFETNVAKSGNQHFGSRMAWLPDTTMLVSVADGGNYIRFDGGWIREQAQNNDNHLGTVVRLTEDGRPVLAASEGDNLLVPLISGSTNLPQSEAGDASQQASGAVIAGSGPSAESTTNAGSTPELSALPEIWTYGHRNIQGLTVDPVTGHVWANEHGARGGDELNLLVAGGNYGWPEVTYSREYHYTRITRRTSKAGMVDPHLVWTPAQAPSGLTVYHGEAFPQWQGNLFSGGLASGEVRRIILNETSVVGEEKLTIGARVRDVREGPDGYLYVLTDESNGRLLRIVPD
ncbi:MAG: PQQ-dependent sugar dehydrogenase [Bacteroidetes bacterium]|nr:PQQ-dependent sugar dehydrogenase [Bacteroidota bacterium]MCH8524568.1 PQQ-dependent sugar dehydrogenase [Balneolales bacterium]